MNNVILRHLHLFLGVLSTLALTGWGPLAVAAQSDLSVEDLKAAIASAAHCEWSDVTFYRSDPADDVHKVDAACGGFRLTLKDEKFYTLQFGYFNADEFHQITQDDVDGMKDEAVSAITAFLPHWKGGRAWLKAHARTVERSDRFEVFVKRVGDVWLIVSQGSLADASTTDFHVTKNPKIVKLVRSHYNYSAQ